MPKVKPSRKKVEGPFAKNLRLILAERGLSQKSAAEVAGTTTSTVNDWLAGSQPADLLCVQRLARALKCDFEWLLTGSQSQFDAREVAMSQIFDGEPDPTFSGVFEISARRLRRKQKE